MTKYYLNRLSYRATPIALNRKMRDDNISEMCTVAAAQQQDQRRQQQQ